MSKKKQRTVGFAFTGSFCTYEKIKEVVRQLVKEDNRVIPIFSQTAQTVNCRFGDARDFIIEIQEITGERGIFSIQEAEPIGPKGLLDILVIAPCTGNTMAKLAAGITDTPVLMAAKSRLNRIRYQFRMGNHRLRFLFAVILPKRNKIEIFCIHQETNVL